MRKISGKIAIVQMMKPLCRYSRSSLRTMARTRLLFTFTSGPPLVLVDQLEVDVLERVVRLPDRQHLGAGRHQRPGDGWCGDGRLGHGQDVGGGAVLAPAVDGRQAAKDPARLGEGGEGPDRERLGEQLLAQLGGSADGAQVVFRIATRSQRRSASSRRWVVRKIVTPLRRSA